MLIAVVRNDLHYNGGMKRITILTYGSRGDVQPCLALAVALRDAGYAPLLALPETLRDLAVDLGIPAVPLPGDIAVISQGFNQAGQNPLGVMRVLKENIEPVALDVSREAFRACHGADAIVHTFLFTLGAHAFARKLGIPDVSAQFFPTFFTSSSYPALGLPETPLGPLYNRLTHLISRLLFAGAQRMMYPRLRKAAPEFPDRLPWPFRASDGRPATPLLLAYSPTLVPPEPDWGENVQPTGFWFLDSAEAYTPPPELGAFLEDGPPPVCTGFGSSIHPNSVQLQRALQEGIRQAGQRAIFLTGWDGWAEAEPGPDRLFLHSAPHDWLFPRCAAIIHHCGAGTTAAGLRSGRPNIPLPLAVDQPFWASRIHACGAGPSPLDHRTLSSQQVADAVRQALGDENIRRAATDVGEAIRSEPGVRKAVDVIQRITGSLTHSGRIDTIKP